MRVMKAFVTQGDLAQSPNFPIAVCKGNIDKYHVNPSNNKNCALYNNTFADGASHTTKAQAELY